MKIDFKDEAQIIKNNLIKIRRQIHQNPELGFCEFETAKLIKTELERIGIEYTSEIAKNKGFLPPYMVPVNQINPISIS